MYAVSFDGGRDYIRYCTKLVSSGGQRASAKCGGRRNMRMYPVKSVKMA